MMACPYQNLHSDPETAWWRCVRIVSTLNRESVGRPRPPGAKEYRGLSLQESATSEGVTRLRGSPLVTVV
jgi:hypothetical protein